MEWVTPAARPPGAAPLPPSPAVPPRLGSAPRPAPSCAGRHHGGGSAARFLPEARGGAGALRREGGASARRGGAGCRAKAAACQPAAVGWRGGGSGARGKMSPQGGREPLLAAGGHFPPPRPGPPACASGDAAARTPRITGGLGLHVGSRISRFREGPGSGSWQMRSKCSSRSTFPSRFGAFPRAFLMQTFSGRLSFAALLRLPFSYLGVTVTTA